MIPRTHRKPNSGLFLLSFVKLYFVRLIESKRIVITRFYATNILITCRRKTIVPVATLSKDAIVLLTMFDSVLLAFNSEPITLCLENI